MKAGLPASRPVLVAHRGDVEHYTENTLAAFAGAEKLGVTHVELDVQVTSDGVPVVLHDPSAARTHGVSFDVRKHTAETLARHGLFDPDRFACPVVRLRDFVAWMGGIPGMHVFVEIKKESIRTRGRERVLEVVGDEVPPIAGRYTLISYDARILAMARQHGHPVGYVLPTMGNRYRTIAENLAPEFVFADCRQIIRAGGTWPGNWKWASFEVEDIMTAKRLIGVGVRYIETMKPAALINAFRRPETLVS